MTPSILVFLGSERVSGAPLPTRLGARVSTVCLRRLADRGVATTQIDPVEVDAPHPFKPLFAYGVGRGPETPDHLVDQIRQADGYVMISPEYNHLMSPALSDLLNRFGSSLFSYKPSAIVTYSAASGAALAPP
jgi:chromate reductase